MTVIVVIIIKIINLFYTK